MTEPILDIEDLNISFYTRAGEIPAVMDFSMTVLPGETMGLVGESGCGKSTVALGIMRYLGHNGDIKSGTVLVNGQPAKSSHVVSLGDAISLELPVPSHSVTQIDRHVGQETRHQETGEVGVERSHVVHALRAFRRCLHVDFRRGQARTGAGVAGAARLREALRVDG